MFNTLCETVWIGKVEAIADDDQQTPVKLVVLFQEVVHGGGEAREVSVRTPLLV